DGPETPALFPHCRHRFAAAARRPDPGRPRQLRSASQEYRRPGEALSRPGEALAARGRLAVGKVRRAVQEVLEEGRTAGCGSGCGQASSARGNVGLANRISARSLSPFRGGKGEGSPRGIMIGMSHIRFDVLTLFPEIFDGFLGESILKLALEKGLVEIHRWNIRDWSPDEKHHKVDDRPFGGGS